MYELSVAAGALALAIWIYLLAARGGFWLMRDESRQAPRATSPLPVIAVIPARNEAATIGRAVKSLVGQVPVVVVDDASDDDTAGIARDAGATVVTARPLPPGWSGKLWAVSEGIRAAGFESSEYWLLTDADIRRLLKKALAEQKLSVEENAIALNIEGAKQLPGPLYAIITLEDREIV